MCMIITNWLMFLECPVIWHVQSQSDPLECELWFPSNRFSVNPLEKRSHAIWIGMMSLKYWTCFDVFACSRSAALKWASKRRRAKKTAKERSNRKGAKQEMSSKSKTRNGVGLSLRFTHHNRLEHQYSYSVLCDHVFCFYPISVDVLIGIPKFSPLLFHKHELWQMCVILCTWLSTDETLGKPRSLLLFQCQHVLVPIMVWHMYIYFYLHQPDSNARTVGNDTN